MVGSSKANTMYHNSNIIILFIQHIALKLKEHIIEVIII